MQWSKILQTSYLHSPCLPRGGRRLEEGARRGVGGVGGGDDVLRSDDAWRIAYHEFVRRRRRRLDERRTDGDSFRHERGPSFRSLARSFDTSFFLSMIESIWNVPKLRTLRHFFQSAIVASHQRSGSCPGCPSKEERN